MLTNLQPSTTYYYIFGSSDSCGWSTEQSFVSAPKVAASTAVSFVAFGDMGKGESDGSLEQFPVWEEFPALNTTKNVINVLDSTDMLLHIGDISYAVGFSAEWDEFMDQISPISMKIPYMTGIGNHERDFRKTAFMTGDDSGGECGIPYERRFPMPGVSGDQPWYSFNFGNIHFTIMSTEHDFTYSSAQYQWIAQDLSSVDRTATPWLIIAGHRPMYIDSLNNMNWTGDQPVAQLLRDNIEPIMLKYRVNLAFWGHHHSYQRTCPVFQENCGPSWWPIHAVIGMAGCGLSQNIEEKQPLHFVKVNDQDYGFSRVFTNETTLHFQYFTNQQPNIPNDEFYINI